MRPTNQDAPSSDNIDFIVTPLVSTRWQTHGLDMRVVLEICCEFNESDILRLESRGVVWVHDDGFDLVVLLQTIRPVLAMHANSGGQQVSIESEMVRDEISVLFPSVNIHLDDILIVRVSE